MIEHQNAAQTFKQICNSDKDTTLERVEKTKT